VKEFRDRWRLKPCMMNGGKLGWLLEHSDISGTVWTIFSYHTTIKAAKRVVAHMRRKPIDLN
jgi:hypothetical protein